MYRDFIETVLHCTGAGRPQTTARRPKSSVCISRVKEFQRDHVMELSKTEFVQVPIETILQYTRSAGRRQQRAGRRAASAFLGSGNFSLIMSWNWLRLADACLLPLLPLGLLNYDMINGLSFLWVLFGYRPQSAHFDIRRLRSLLRLWRRLPPPKVPTTFKEAPCLLRLWRRRLSPVRLGSGDLIETGVS